MDVLVGIEFQIMITMAANPHDRIAGQGDSRASCKKKLDPLRHFKAAMCQIPMQIKCRADSATKKERQHDPQIGKVKSREQSNQAEQLKSDQDKKNEQLNLFAFKHAAQGQEQPTGPQLNPESAQSDK